MNEPEQQSNGLIAPAVILVEPQLGENIGTAARAMANFGLTDLRLVNPRDGWPSEKARAAASRADHVIDAVVVHETVESAIADLKLIYATTARARDMLKPVRGPEAAAQTMVQLAKADSRSGILFGRERWGLTNDEIALADEIITYPVDQTFSSLNIAQAVLILAYEWQRQTAPGAPLPFDLGENAVPADKVELIRLFEHLESALDGVGYFKPDEKRPTMVRNLRTMLQKASLTELEVRTLRGVVAALELRHLKNRQDW